MRKSIILIATLFIYKFSNSQSYYQVTVDVLNVRSSASKEADIVGKLNLGDSVYTIEYSSGWSKVKFNDSDTGYVASKYLSSEFKNYASKTKDKKSSGKKTGWTGILIVIAILLVWLFKGKSKGSPNKKPTYNNSKPVSPKPQKNELISQVKLEGSWYRVYNSDGKQLSVKAKHSNDYLLGYSDKIILLEEGSWYRLYDFNFKQISVKAVHDNDRYLGVAGMTITFQEGSWIRTYDTKFKQINVRAAR